MRLTALRCRSKIPELDRRDQTMALLAETELRNTLQSLERLRESAVRAREQKKAQHREIAQEISSMGESIRSIDGSILVVRRALGLPQNEAAKAEAARPDSGDGADSTRQVMLIVAGRDDSGGITIQEIDDALKQQGVVITRMYLHTILNRKKNRQKKLEKRGVKWFLTDKGKEELGINL
jgi:hypothetical protein